MKLTARVSRALLRRLLPQPVSARHAEYSMIFSGDDESSRPSPRLMAIALQAIQFAMQETSTRQVSARMPNPPYYPDVWPGENYKLLAGLVRTVKPSLITEIGTGGGTSTLTMRQVTPPGGRIVTFDVLGWRDWPGSLLREDDFADGRLEQSTDDVSDPAMFARHRALFAQSQLIFLDAAKDGVMEQRILDHLQGVTFPTPPLLVFDDIRVWNMLRTWRNICFPKLDLTSFGHWTGTGLVDWGASA